MSDWSVINAPLAPGLYIVATPLGHARDITLRALDVLAAANAIYCEDTRVSGKLMARYGIATPRLAYHEHNAQRMRPKILQRLAEGAALALISPTCKLAWMLCAVVKDTRSNMDLAGYRRR
ncbi:MAG: hypothetical protein EBT71_03120 [Alphaproteobacteria bacterium]|nr:hypothetical protein [Alphaproteobacteria bacterium]